MTNFSTIRKIAVGVISVIIVLTCGFIWGNSLMSQEQSSESSETVSEVIQTVIDSVLG